MYGRAALPERAKRVPDSFKIKPFSRCDLVGRSLMVIERIKLLYEVLEYTQTPDGQQVEHGWTVSRGADISD